MRGDRPLFSTTWDDVFGFTPHARGSTRIYQVGFWSFLVYPACAGIDPTQHTYTHHTTSLPRMRGDRPMRIPSIFPPRQFTPHARGSTPGGPWSWRALDVYPACAGIDRKSFRPNSAKSRLPRMRGDRPPRGGQCPTARRFTPHARGSTLDSR